MTNLFKKHSIIKTWVLTLLILSLTGSLIINRIYFVNSHKQFDEVLHQYSNALVSVQQAFNSSIFGEPKDKDKYLIMTYEYLAIAREMAVLLAKLDDKYDPTKTIYQTVPYDLKWLLDSAQFSDNKEILLLKVHEAYQIFAKYLDTGTLYNPDSFNRQYSNIISQWDLAKLKEAGLSFPVH